LGINETHTNCAAGKLRLGYPKSITPEEISFLINVFLSVRNGKDAGDNPWNALTPEWLTSSPPPVENWEGEAPLVEEPYGYGKEISERK